MVRRGRGCRSHVHGAGFLCVELQMQEDLSFPAVLVEKKGKQGDQGGEGV